MRTQAALLTEHRKALDKAWHEKWPNGQFVIQRFNGEFGIYWNSGRNTSRRRRLGIGAYLPRNGDEIRIVNHQNNRFGRCTYYDSYDKLRKGAMRLKMPIMLFIVFSDYYERFHEQT